MNIDIDAVIGELRKPEGWQQGSLGAWRNAYGPVCVLGAAQRLYGDWQPLADALAPIVVEAYADRLVMSDCDEAYDHVTEFNDHRDTTLDDVILVCEKARARMGEVA